ncbi:MAG: hypothetical protein Q27BPR15_17335 [Rhodobacter sp. CACIA14H1]|nr:MAG: hypothetical protein Q27BPR15_17335 [Rhodobacter sp. CACIA14H1]
MNESRLKALITGTDDLSGASLASRIFLNRLRIEVRHKPASLPDKLAELAAFMAKNPFAAEDFARL